VIEACSRNLFAVQKGNLLTPALHRAGVAGILRRRILDTHAKRLGLVVQEKPVDLNLLLNADEIFLTNSVTGVWPVSQLLNETGSLGARERSPRYASQFQALYELDLEVGCNDP
jgi:4-amino-4-deoxychorismate lyase